MPLTYVDHKDLLVERQFRHFPVVSGREGRGGAVCLREGDRGEPGAVLDRVEVDAADAVMDGMMGRGGGGGIIVVEGVVA